MLEVQKANFWKRISAFMLDAILLVMLAVGIFGLFSWMFDYDAYADRIQAGYDKYAEKYGIDADISEEDYDALPDEEKQKYIDASEEMMNDEALNRDYMMFLNLTLIFTTFSILLAYLILEFIVPLLFKNGQTVGKKVFALGVMQSNGVRISPLALFARTVLGKFTVETMVPVFLIIRMAFGSGGLLGVIIILIILITQIAFLLSTQSRLSIHDMLASTVVVDLPSQKIFDSVEQMNEYKKRLHAQKAEKADYWSY